ncbi:MAG: DUF4293 domain-containing protein [Bacteroidales bacterium]|nr:DUF4293 domain-containing protein [Bacteroidales bacterium]
MIQRIQSVYLALVVVLSGLMLVPFANYPLAKFYGNTATLHFYSTYIKNLIPGEPSPFSSYFNWPLTAGIVLIMILALSALFYFKNRKAQMNLVKANILINLILLTGFFFGYLPFLEKKLETQAIYQATSFIPALLLLLLVLAYQGIKKDDKLVKSMDRIR